MLCSSKLPDREMKGRFTFLLTVGISCEMHSGCKMMFLIFWLVLMLAQNSSVCIKTRIRRIVLPCRWNGSSNIHFLRSYGWQSLSKWHLQLSEHYGQVLRLRNWALCHCCSVKTALPECKDPVPMAQLGHALNPEASLAFLWLDTVTCTSPVMAKVLFQCCLLSVCLSFLDNVKTLELWFLSASCIAIISERQT